MERQIINTLISFMIISGLTVLLSGCKKNEASSTIPVISTFTVTNILQTTASCGGNISSDGGATVRAKGVCWSTNQNPIITDNLTHNGTGTSSFISNITGLIINTTYYVRAYATNSEGTAYGNPLSFTTLASIQPPVIITLTASEITNFSAIIGGNVRSDGGAAITIRGVYWGTSTHPVISGTKLEIGMGAGLFSTSLSGLTLSTNYYVVAFAVNSEGEALGNEVSFSTTNVGQTGTVTDIDGNIYITVIIGTQEWMAENLKTTKYSNGSPISNVTDATTWAGLTTRAYCYYDNKAANATTYGALYNWYAINSGNLCPTGWHVPTDGEWTTLMDYLGGESEAGGKLKSVSGWNAPNNGATNERGFSALPGGSRYFHGIFIGIGCQCGLWSSTESGPYDAWYRDLYNNNPEVDRILTFKQDGFSVRCLKDF